MKLSDAAVWEIEMGRTPPAPLSPASSAYRLFDPVFAALPWLRKARLKVVDRQAGAAPEWIVVQDLEDPPVFLLLGPAGASLVSPSGPSLGAPTGKQPGSWAVQGTVGSPEDLVRALRLQLGSGRHIG